MIHDLIGDFFGHLFVIIAFVASIFSAISYYMSVGKPLDENLFWKRWGRTFFYVHGASVIAIVGTLFLIIYNHYFEYHYAWSHSSKHLPVEYMISCFWEGQEGSFLLWAFWHVVLGVVVMNTNRFWEGPVMTVFALVQAFLASMILGVVIPGIEYKIGSSPFILMRDAMDAPIFQTNPNFIPEDGTGLNALLQNYWMVIHPPTLFLGYAAMLVPFSYCIAGLWLKKFKEWVGPAIPWTIFSSAILGLGILMGGYWAYETLSFGGYWNWDPVENAVYVPWLVGVASLHTMILFRSNATALKLSIILTIASFILILYSTFMTRSGVLGDASVHSFTDLGLSGQLLIYLVFFTVWSIALSVVRWKEIPSTQKELSTYTKEFWVFIGAAVLCLMGFQVLVPTSIPVYNSFMGLFGIDSNIAPPADPVVYYSKFQLWFAAAVAIISGIGQFFFWKNLDKAGFIKAVLPSLMLTLIVSALGIVLSGIGEISFIVLLTAAIFLIISNLNVLIKILKKNPKLSGGAIAHIGIAMVLIGILFSSGYSTVISLNNSGLKFSDSKDFNNENLLLFVNDPVKMQEFELTYQGDFVEDRQYRSYFNKTDLEYTNNLYKVVAKANLKDNGTTLYKKGDTLEIYPENTYYKIQYKNESGGTFSLYPRAQINEGMGGLLASPDIKRFASRDLYTHISSIPNPEEPVNWSEQEEVTAKIGEKFFINDYVAVLDSINPVQTIEGVTLNEGDIAIKAMVRIMGEIKDYYVEPVFIIKDKMAGRIGDEVSDLAFKITLLHVHPDTNEFTFGIQTRQKNWIVMKALEKPMINILWIGTLVLMFGFTVSFVRRFTEFLKSRNTTS